MLGLQKNPKISQPCLLRIKLAHWRSYLLIWAGKFIPQLRAKCTPRAMSALGQKRTCAAHKVICPLSANSGRDDFALGRLRFLKQLNLLHELDRSGFVSFHVESVCIIGDGNPRILTE